MALQQTIIRAFDSLLQGVDKKLKEDGCIHGEFTIKGKTFFFTETIKNITWNTNQYFKDYASYLSEKIGSDINKEEVKITLQFIINNGEKRAQQITSFNSPSPALQSKAATIDDYKPKPFDFARASHTDLNKSPEISVLAEKPKQSIWPFFKKSTPTQDASQATTDSIDRNKKKGLQYTSFTKQPASSLPPVDSDDELMPISTQPK